MHPKIPIVPNDQAGWRFVMTTYGDFGLRRIEATNRLMRFKLCIDEQADHTWKAVGIGSAIYATRPMVKRWTEQAKAFSKYLFKWEIGEWFEDWCPLTISYRW